MDTIFPLPAVMHVRWHALHVPHLQTARLVLQLTIFPASPVLRVPLIVTHVLMLHIAKLVVQIIHLLPVIFVHPVMHLAQLALQTVHVLLALSDIIWITLNA